MDIFYLPSIQAGHIYCCSSEASIADRILKWLATSCPCEDSKPDFSQQPGSTRLSGRFNPLAEAGVLDLSAKQAYILGL